MSAAQPLAGLLYSYLIKTRLLETVPGAIIVPIPLHRSRARRRGFNQAELIARSLLSLVSEPKSGLETENLVRIRNTASQTSRRTYDSRKENIAGCFRVLHPERVNGKTILLLDDVYTSGATMSEAVSVLKSAGAHRIIALTVARA